ncbi:hypothetical protein C6348_00360 [Bacillus sp. YBWC18]|uniref:Uncharacterized protein n=1 Tax=Bacillus pumilus TaxID=1408 RepID=A0AAE3WG40_BACPU|nr:hypothetical protein [Bacillus pumilus]PAC83779.1 hypothetical protein CHI05_00310 [Bacillus sp. 7788]PRS82646.1 hypothetical protein C6346_00360 [Bacillus sp. CJCL2]PRS87394.1 hypothetical protein C6348_00360 [Bacillus sp. YBWC18]
MPSFFKFTFQPVHHLPQNKKRLDEHILIKPFIVSFLEIRLDMLLFTQKGTSNKPTSVPFFIQFIELNVRLKVLA